MKAQSSFEMLVTVATMLAYSIPIILMVFSMSTLRLEDTAILHATATVQQLADTINDVYLQGSPAKRSILIDLPSSTRNLTVSGNTVTLYMYSSGGPYEISHPIIANATDFSISGKSGLMPLTVRMNGTMVVLE